MATTETSIDAAEPPVTATTIAPHRRKRPLRTYSRRSLQDREEQPERTTEDTTHRGSGSDSGGAEAPIELPSLPRQDQVQGSKRGSILSYFKPLAASSDNDAASDTPSSDPVEPVLTTPQSSPPPLSNSRKRRRLTTRPQFCMGDQHSKDGAGHGTRYDADSAEDTGVLRASSPIIDESTIIVATEAYDPMRSPLDQVTINVLHQQAGAASAPTDRVQRIKRPRDKRQTRDMTQTTLSLSVHKEPGFTICGVCDILYNPLNEKDRREHRRRHAAHSRTKAKPA